VDAGGNSRVEGHDAGNGAPPPVAHQTNAVYGSMLPQPRLRFLLADEPGTGKTIMAGMYLREMQRLGFVKRGLVICPAHLVEKWRADFARFFGGGLRRITAATVREGALAVDHDLWVTSLDLASVNAMVQEAIRPDRAGWDVVVIDEAHRMTLSAQAYYQLGRLMSRTPRVVLMAATPHPREGSPSSETSRSSIRSSDPRSAGSRTRDFDGGSLFARPRSSGRAIYPQAEPRAPRNAPSHLVGAGRGVVRGDSQRRLEIVVEMRRRSELLRSSPDRQREI
jgi:hypothetical protein